MDRNEAFKSAISNTINNLVKARKNAEPESVDMGLFVASIKKELVSLQIPVYDVYVSRYRDSVVVIELPFCKSCEIQVNPIEFGSDKLKAELFIDKRKMRSIRLAQMNSKYMTQVANALVDYFKRFLLLKNKFN